MKKLTLLQRLIILTLGVASVGFTPHKSQALDPPAQVGTQQLGLSQTHALAIQNNLSLLISRYQKQQGEQASSRVRQAYVPSLSIDLGWSDDVSLIADERNRSLAYGAQVNWTLPQGTGLFARLEALEFLSGQSFVPQPSNKLQLGVSQPLLQGFGQGVDNIDRAKAEVKQQQAVFASVLNDFLLEVEQSYWSLVLAQNDVVIKQRSRERAQKQFDDMTENIRRGLVAPGEIFIVEENLVFFTQQLIRSEEALTLAQTRLARLIRVDPNTEITATDDLEKYAFKAPPSLEEALNTALANNPSVQAAEFSLSQQKETLSIAQNQYKPQLDLSAAATLNGVDQSRAQAWKQVVTAQQPGWQVGLDFTIPLDRSPDRARLEITELATAQARTVVEDARDDVRYGIKEELTRWQRRLEVLNLSEKRMNLALEKLQTEQEKYKSGLSTLANVVLFQRDLDSARIGLQSARLDVVLAAVRLYRLQGTLSQHVGVEVQ